MEFLELTETEFDQQLDCHPFMVIEFWAPWCAPCVSLAKICSELACEMQDVKFARVNIDAEKNLAEEFAVTSLPLLWIMRRRVILHTVTGMIGKLELVQLIKDAQKCAVTMCE